MFRPALGIRFVVASAVLAPLAAQGAPPQPAPIVIERKGGPPTIPDVPRDQVIAFALYTVHAGVLKLTAQLYPLQADDSRQVVLEVRAAANPTGRWRRVATAPVDPEGWFATFRQARWDHRRDHAYRLSHAGGARYEGLIRRAPVKDEIVVAGLSCNSNSDRGPRADIVGNLKVQDPDLLFFAGDQSYDHKSHTAAWLLFGRQFGDIMRDRPTITIPDDHDVGQPNLWGAGGKAALRPDGADGGYVMSASYVNMVQRAQTSHLPDPVDPKPVAQGIGVYYTSLNLGGIDFAIIEDRKWKTGPAGLVPQQGPRPDHINDPAYDRRSIDVPEAELLGARQLAFLRRWGQDWRGAEMKVVLSQTIFAGGAHLHGSHTGRLLADLDSNGWPQSGRARALEEIRRFFGFHLAGDQHIATVIHHGVHDWEDAGVSFCVPAIENYYGRWWWPLEPSLGGPRRQELPYTGRYHDGFGNKVTVHAYANPSKETHNGAGYGLVRFRKNSREIVMENWPRDVDVTKATARQYPGWPVTVSQLDNHGRKPIAVLPTVEASFDDPVIRVLDQQNGDLVYTIRIKGRRFQPKVFREGLYTVRVDDGQGGKPRVWRDVASGKPEDGRVLSMSAR